MSLNTTAALTNNALPARRRAAVLLMWLALVLASVWQITRTSFVADLTAFLPASPDAQQRVLIEQLQSGTPARTLLIGIDGGTAQTRADASRALAGALRKSGLFEQVNNGETEAWTDVGTWLFEHRYALSPAIEPQRFTPAGLKEGINETLSLLGTPLGNTLKPLLNRDPTGETQRIAESLIPSSAPRSEAGVWTSRQGGRALLVAGTQAPGADLDAQAVAVAKVREAFTEVAKAQPGLTLKVSGAPVFGVDSRAQIEREIKWLSVVGTGIMATLLLLAFASLPALLVAMLPVASGVLAGIVAVSLFFGSVHGITLGFGTTLIGEAVDYAIYFLIQARGLKDSGGWRAWVRESWPTVRLGLLTSVCGFTALLFSGFPGLMQLGVFSVAGLIGAVLATRHVLPVLMPDGAQGSGLRRQMGAFATWAVRGLPRLRWPLLALGVAALAVLCSRGDHQPGSAGPGRQPARRPERRRRAQPGGGASGELAGHAGTSRSRGAHAGTAGGSGPAGRCGQHHPLAAQQCRAGRAQGRTARRRNTERSTGAGHPRRAAEGRAPGAFRDRGAASACIARHHAGKPEGHGAEARHRRAAAQTRRRQLCRAAAPAGRSGAGRQARPAGCSSGAEKPARRADAGNRR